MLALVLVVASGHAQLTRHRSDPNSPRIKATDVPFPFIQKQINFKLVPLDKTKFILMASQVATLPTGFGGKLKSPQPVVCLEYGSKKGGVGWVYETAAVPGATPEAIVKLVTESGAFHDTSRRPAYKMIGQVVNGAFIVAGSADPGIVELETASIKALH